MKKISQLILLFFLSLTAVSAQVQYQLEWLPVNQSYRVSMVVEQTWEAPMNMVATAQVTLKVPTGGFEIANVENLLPQVVFSANSRQNAPTESAAYDYISFGLETLGTSNIPFVAGTTVPLFTFQNLGECNGVVSLVTENDAFFPPNSAKANIGNTMTVLGANGNAYTGNTGDGIDCSGLVGTTIIDKVATFFNVFPNPVQNDLNIQFVWKRTTEAMNINIYDVHGKLVKTSNEVFSTGENALKINTEKLTSGIYSLEIQNDDIKMMIEKFIKN